MKIPRGAWIFSVGQRDLFLVFGDESMALLATKTEVPGSDECWPTKKAVWLLP
jgi:hypothetical protein